MRTLLLEVIHLQSTYRTPATKTIVINLRILLGSVKYCGV